MQLRSWKLKLQPKIMSYLDKRHVARHHALSSMIIFSFSLSHSHSHTHSHTHKHSHTDITSNADGYFLPFLFFLLSYSVQSTYVGFISICTFKTAWIYGIHWKNWSDVINKGTYWLNKTIQTTPTKTFRNRCMKLPFPSRQPSVLHSSPLWLLACSTGLSQVCFEANRAAIYKYKIKKGPNTRTHTK